MQRRVAICLLVALVALAACTGGGTSASPSPLPPGPGRSPVPGRAGGSVVIARPVEASSYLPHSNAGSSPAAREAWGPTLLGLADLVDEAVEDEAGRVLRVRLRPGLVWSDGVPITAADVVFTWRLALDLAFPAWDRARFAAVTAIEPAADPLSFGARLSEPSAGWMARFDPVLPAHRLSNGRWQDWRAPGAFPDVASGPFRFTARTPGLSVTLERNARFSGPPAFLDRVVLLLVPDPITANRLYQSGEVDVLAPPTDTRAGPILSALAPTVAVDAGRTAVAVANPNLLTSAPARAAVLDAIPSEELAESVLKEEATPVARPAVAPGGAELALTGTTVTISWPEEMLNFSLLARATQRSLAARGATVELRAREGMRFWDEWWVPTDFEIAFSVVSQGDALPKAGLERVGLWHEVQRVAARPGVTVAVDPGPALLTSRLAEWSRSG